MGFIRHSINIKQNFILDLNRKENTMDYILGTIVLFPYSRVPMGWYKCDGRLLQVSGNEPLYSLLGNAYGGTYESNFNLPNMLGLEPIPNMCFYICFEGIYPTRP
jgi:hypothetical protein